MSKELTMLAGERERENLEWRHIEKRERERAKNENINHKYSLHTKHLLSIQNDKSILFSVQN